MHALSYTYYMPERVYVTKMRLRCIGGSVDRYEKWVDGNLDSVTGRGSACVLWSLCDKVTRLYIRLCLRGDLVLLNWGKADIKAETKHFQSNT